MNFKWDEIMAHANENKRMNYEDILSPEYPAELIQSGQRGKYAKRYREGTNIAIIEPDLYKLFPDSEAVNRALRIYAKERNMAVI
jgi:hypothetical protein